SSKPAAAPAAASAAAPAEKGYAPAEGVVLPRAKLPAPVVAATPEAAKAETAAANRFAGTKLKPQVGADRETAIQKGYTGDSCGQCGHFTMVRNGACLKCMTCGSSSGCS